MTLYGECYDSERVRNASALPDHGALLQLCDREPLIDWIQIGAVCAQTDRTSDSAKRNWPLKRRLHLHEISSTRVC